MITPVQTSRLLTDNPASEPVRHNVIRTCLRVGLLLTTGYGLIALFQAEYTAAVFNALSAAAIVSGLLILRFNRWNPMFALFCILFSLPLFVYDVFRASPARYDLLWSFILPVFVLLLVGRKTGVLILIVYWILAGLLLYTGAPDLSIAFKATFLALLAAISFCLWLYETFRVRALDRQAESERAFRDFVDHLPQITFEFDHTGRFTYVNEPALRAFGYTREDLQKGLHAAQMFPPEERERAMNAIRERLLNNTADTHEYTAMRKDGARFPVLIHSNPVLVNGKPAGLRGIVVDITELKRAQAEKEALREQLHQVEKMDAVGQLAGGIAHDFNNQLTGISGFADLIATDAEKSNPELAGYAQHIKRISNRASDLTSQLLAFARKGKYLSVRVDMHRLIHDTCAILERSIDKRILIHRSLSASNPVVQGDPSQLQSLLLNLAINSRDAMPMGGQITLATDEINLSAGDSLLESHKIPPGPYFRLSIADTGSGMSPEVQRRMFEPFFTTKAPGKGTGIGLAAVYGTILGHHGCITVKSAPGAGTAISVYFPVADGSEPPDQQSSPAVLAETATTAIHTGPKARLLVVDDEEPVRDMLEALLENQGYAVHGEADGHKAEAWFSAHWKETDLVLLDMIMPELNGRAVWERLRKIHPAVKVLLISGYSIEGDAQEMLSQGVQGFLQKPFDSAKLQTAINRILGS